MTLEEIAATLPNGLHDAYLIRLDLDYRGATARLALDVCVGDPEAGDKADRERMRLAEIVLQELVFAVIEPPDVRGLYPISDRLRIDLDDVPEEVRQRLPSVPCDAFMARLFVSPWNAFIILAARDAALRWSDETA